MVPCEYNFIKVETPTRKAYESSDATTQGNREVGSSHFKTDKKTENLPKTIKKCFLQNLPATQGNVKVFKKGCTWVVAGWYYNIMASVAHSVLGDIRVLKY